MTAPPPVGGDRYDAALRVMVPYTEPEDVRQLRRRLMTSRDLASQTMCSSAAHSEQTYALARVILDVASTHCFRVMPKTKLRDAADLCVRLLQASAALHRLESPDATH